MARSSSSEARLPLRRPRRGPPVAPQECRSFFRDLCTPAELQALIDRWAVVILLREGLTYREIHDRTGVSVTTVGRVARFLTEGFGGYRAVAKRLLT